MPSPSATGPALSNPMIVPGSNSDSSLSSPRPAQLTPLAGLPGQPPTYRHNADPPRTCRRRLCSSPTLIIVVRPVFARWTQEFSYKALFPRSHSRLTRDPLASPILLRRRSSAPLAPADFPRLKCSCADQLPFSRSAPKAPQAKTS